MQVHNIKQYKIRRINKDEFYEEIFYTGNLKNKPKGWKIKF